MKLTTTNGKNGKIHLHIDGEYYFTAPAAAFYSSGYSSAADIDEQALSELISSLSAKKAYEKALDFLSRRDHSVKELSLKLLRTFDDESVAYAIEKATDNELLSDERFAAIYGRACVERKGFSERRLREELKYKGISEEIIENVLETLEINPIMRIIDMLNTKYRKKLLTEKGRQSAYNALLRLGYSYSDINSAFREIETDV